MKQADAIVRQGDDGGQITFIPQLDIPQSSDLFFRVKIAYHGPFTVGHETGALWLNLNGQFVLRGGADYNYNR